MDISILISLISIIPATFLSLAAFITSIKNGTKIQEVHLSLNSRLSQLVEASKALGALEQRAYTDDQNAEKPKKDVKE
jgi:hypothetical protein